MPNDTTGFKENTWQTFIWRTDGDAGVVLYRRVEYSYQTVFNNVSYRLIFLQGSYL